MECVHGRVLVNRMLSVARVSKKGTQGGGAKKEGGEKRKKRK